MLQVENLQMHFPARGDAQVVHGSRTVKAVDGMSFSVQPGEVVAVVGESGCGKSTLARLLVRLLEPTAGTIRLNGQDVGALSGDELRKFRLAVQMVFQDPFGSLNPRMNVGDAIAYPLRVNTIYRRRERKALELRVAELLERVQLSSAHARRLPHELSGGQRQRVGIARAIAVNPQLVVLDEPVAALDVSAQAHVLNLFKTLQRDMDMAYVFITHDLSVAEYMADRILVMYAGKVMEMGSRAILFEDPGHPYTEALLSAAVLGRWRDSAQETILEGDPPSPIDPPPGCRFSSRCPHVASVCELEAPTLAQVHDNDKHLAACHLVTGRLERSDRSWQRTQ